MEEDTGPRRLKLPAPRHTRPVALALDRSSARSATRSSRLSRTGDCPTTERTCIGRRSTLMSTARVSSYHLASPGREADQLCFPVQSSPQHEARRTESSLAQSATDDGATSTASRSTSERSARPRPTPRRKSPRRQERRQPPPRVKLRFERDSGRPSPPSPPSTSPRLLLPHLHLLRPQRSRRSCFPRPRSSPLAFGRPRLNSQRLSTLLDPQPSPADFPSPHSSRLRSFRSRSHLSSDDEQARRRLTNLFGRRRWSRVRVRRGNIARPPRTGSGSRSRGTLGCL